MYDFSAIITVAFTGVVLLVTNDDVGDIIFLLFLLLFQSF